MNNLAMNQLFELGIVAVAAAVYIALHFVCGMLAVLISGKKSGVIRGFVQGTMFCAVFAVAGIFALNGAFKWYHIFVYVMIIALIMKTISFAKLKIARAKIEKKDKKLK